MLHPWVNEDVIFQPMKYCKSGNFHENFNFQNSVKRQTFDRKILRLGFDSPISVVERVISPFCEDFIFTKLRIRGFYFHESSHMRSFAKIKSSQKNSEFTVQSSTCKLRSMLCKGRFKFKFGIHVYSWHALTHCLLILSATD